MDRELRPKIERIPMIDIIVPQFIAKTMLEAMDSAITELDNVCSECDGEGKCSFAKGRLYSAKKIFEELSKEVISGKEK